MTPSPTIQRIKAKLSATGVKLLPPLPEIELIRFEEAHSIKLPADYRQFLLHLGNGGDGPPEYGLCLLGNPPPDFERPHPDLSKPFPFTKPWCWENGEISSEGTMADLELGLLILGTDGCGQYWALVTNGPDFGQIWMLTDVGILPLPARLQFSEWYEAWLDGKRDWWS